MFQAQHRNADVRVGQRGQFRAEAVNLVAEQDADGESWSPVENVYALRRRFYGGYLLALRAQMIGQRDGIPRVIPWHRFLRSERGFRDGVGGRMAGDAAQVELRDACAIGG